MTSETPSMDPAFRRVVDSEMEVALAVEAAITKYAGRRMHFALVVYEHGSPPPARCQFHYLSNTPIEVVEPRLAEMLKSWDREIGAAAVNEPMVPKRH